MSPILQAHGTIKGSSHRMGALCTSTSPSSMASSGGESDMQSKFIRANTPSKYLKRTGLMPKGTTLKIKTRYNTSIVSSCSSSAATSPSSSISNSNIIGHRSWPVVHSGTASLPSLTEYNLARFMEQLNISDRSRHGVHSSSPTPYSAVEISHFSDGSSSHSGTD